MINFEKFKEKNINVLNELIESNTYSFNQNFLEVYKMSKNFSKYILKNNLYLLKSEDDYVGYVWIEKIELNNYRIIDMYLKLDYIRLFKVNQIKKLKNKVVIYESLENYENQIIALNNSLYKVNTVNILKKILTLSECCLIDEEDVKFEKFVMGKDEELRVNIQNEIFHTRNRIPINKIDLKSEQKTVNYIKEFSIFEYVNNEPVGYAQIIKRNGKYLMVNFGIIEKFRGRGLGEKLLNYMCKLAKENEVSSIYIYVDKANHVALSLYRKLGFLSFGEISTWIKDDSRL